MNNDEISEAFVAKLERMNEALKMLPTDALRIKCKGILFHGICEECGTVTNNCQCWNEE